MTDFLTWSPISLGRWFGTAVRVHISLIVFVVYTLVTTAVTLAASGQLDHIKATACWLALLLLALFLHELAHAMTAYWLDCDQEEVHIWPLGSLVGPSYVPRSSEHVLVALAGPVVSGAIFLGSAFGVSVIVGYQFAWNPFGNFDKDAGAGPRHDGLPVAALSPDLVHRLVRLLEPHLDALQLDPGPALRFRPDVPRLRCQHIGGLGSRSIAAPWTAHTFAVLLGIIGVARLALFRQYDGLTVIGLAVLIEVLVRSEARMLEDGGYFEDGVFGYDFSEGYTSLESGAAKVRPYREKRPQTLAPPPVRAAPAAAHDPRGRRGDNGWTRSSKSCTARDAARSPMRSIASWFASAPVTATGPRTRDRANRLRRDRICRCLVGLSPASGRGAILEEIERTPIVLDAGIGTRLVRRTRPQRDDPAIWCLTHQDEVAAIHRRDVASGTCAIVTNTFGANRSWLARFGQVASVGPINRRAVQLAQSARA